MKHEVEEIYCVHRARVSSSLEKSLRACQFGAHGQANDPAGEKSISLVLSVLPLSLPLPSYVVRPFRMERLREHRATQKDARLPLSLLFLSTLSSFRIRVRLSLITAPRKVAETLSFTSLPNRPEMRGSVLGDILEKKILSPSKKEKNRTV